MDSKTEQLCSFEGCSKPYYGRGYCNGHWQQLRDGRPLRRLRTNRSNGDCATRDCLGRKQCMSCRAWLQEELFHKHRSTLDGFQTSCTACMADRTRFSTYKLTPRRWAEMLIRQHNSCAICRQQFKDQICVDHDHSCCPGKTSCGKCVRSLLCRSCNHGLGNFTDSIDRLLSAVQYLETHRRGES